MSRPFDEAVARARVHLRGGAREGLEAARALLDAARLAAPDSPLSNRLGDDFGAALDRLIETLGRGGRIELPPALGAPIALALEREISRWQARSEREPEARLVLRGLLGLRELLWEVGVRPEARPPTEPGPAPEPARSAVVAEDEATTEPEGESATGPRTGSEARSTTQAETHAQDAGRSGAARPARGPRVQRFDIEH